MAHIELDLADRRTLFSFLDRKLPISRIADAMS